MAAPATCDISGTVYRGDGVAVEGATVKASIHSTADDMGGQFVDMNGISSSPVEAFTDDTGSFTITLAQGGVFLLEIPEISLRKEVVVPALPSALLADIV